MFFVRTGVGIIKEENTGYGNIKQKLVNTVLPGIIAQKPKTGL